MKELYRGVQFTRFNISVKGVLWSVMDDCLSPRSIFFFAKRFPLFYIMLEHKGRTYVLKNGLRLKVYDEPVDVVLKMYEEKLPDISLLEGLCGDGQELWETFYDSQYIKSRKNHKLFHHWIPKKLKGIKGLKKEFESLNPCKKLTDY